MLIKQTTTHLFTCNEMKNKNMKRDMYLCVHKKHVWVSKKSREKNDENECAPVGGT